MQNGEVPNGGLPHYSVVAVSRSAEIAALPQSSLDSGEADGLSYAHYSAATDGH